MSTVSIDRVWLHASGVHAIRAAAEELAPLLVDLVLRGAQVGDEEVEELPDGQLAVSVPFLLPDGRQVRVAVIVLAPHLWCWAPEES